MTGPLPARNRMCDMNRFLIFSLVLVLFCSSSMASPPYAGLRTPGEFERTELVLVVWDNDPLFLGIVDGLVPCVKVGVVVSSSYQQSQAENYLQQNGVPLDNVIFVQADYDSIWIRDYGPITIYENNYSRSVIDVIYDRSYRVDDDLFPQAFADLYGWQRYDLPIQFGIGNFMSNGREFIVSTNAIISENNSTYAAVAAVMQDYFGTETYVALQPLVDDPSSSPTALVHIDMQAKLLAPGLAVVISVPQGHTYYNRLEANVSVLESLSLANGQDLEVFRLPIHTSGTSPVYTYSNSLIANDVVLLPVYGYSEDQDAIDSYSALLPGKTIVPLDCADIIWMNGAIHCITMQIPAMAADLNANGRTDMADTCLLLQQLSLGYDFNLDPNRDYGLDSQDLGIVLSSQGQESLFFQGNVTM